MMWEFAGDFICLGKSQEQKQSHLNAACSAWNIACNPPEQRRKLLDRYMTEFLRFNPDIDPVNVAAIRGDMEKLVEKKLQMFPVDRRHIVNARLVPMGDKERIDVVSARVE
jgi:hypothetical protein